ncbi:MAG: trypsin-like serine protease [Pseudobdellovibrio sp.]
MKKILLLITLIGFTAHSKNNFTDILKGDPVDADHPLAASVVGILTKISDPGYTPFYIPSCTGSVYSKNLILTAAHCVKNKIPSDVAVNYSLETTTIESQMFQGTRIDFESQFIVGKVKDVIVHPLYDGSGNHDIALISLIEDIPGFKQPVAFLPAKYIKKEMNETTFEGSSKNITLIGYGIWDEQHKSQSRVVRFTTLNGIFAKNLVITDQTKGYGACRGDSGGPAFLQIDSIYYQIGITHGAHAPSKTCHETGEYLNPSLDTDFLNETVEKLNKH